MAYTAIDNPELYFQTELYTGNGSSGHAQTLDGEEDMQPDLVWMKNRDATGEHFLIDAARGVTKDIHSNTNAAEGTDANSLTAFGSDGFTVGSQGDINGNTEKMVAWCWKANGSGSSNTDGTINTTKTSASTTAGFSINTFTGSGSNATIGHGLGAVPEMIISKETGGTNDWYVYHIANGNTHGLRLSTNDAKEDDATLWNDTDPTSSVYSVGTNTGTNDSSAMVSYVFAPKQGYSKFKSYTETGNANGTFVFTGMRPAFLMVRRADTGNNWVISDAKRSTFNVINTFSKADANTAESTNVWVDFLSNGFKIRDSGNGWNASGGTYVYMAFAKQPFVNSKGVPNNAR